MKSQVQSELAERYEQEYINSLRKLKNRKKQYMKYKSLANQISNLVCCGRLSDFRYYNMDQAIANAINVVGHEKR